MKSKNPVTLIVIYCYQNPVELMYPLQLEKFHLYTLSYYVRGFGSPDVWHTDSWII
jgi:hypothetical protein